MAKKGSGNEATTGEPVSWRELAVARSLDSARTRAENRVQRFLDAALELMEGDSKEFTVQEVVERSGQSLRSFYQYFGGKHELLLALFEESVRSAADQVRQKVARESDPRERLHRFVVDYYRVCRPSPKETSPKDASLKKVPSPSPVLVEFAQQLLTAHPNEASRAFVPLVTLFDEILDEAAEAGVIRPEIRRRAVAGMVLEAIMFNAFSATIAGASVHDGDVDGAEELWDLIFRGMAQGR
ncbi:MAG TPA: TetR/AcrR family transcriptional regulator [Acidimicrobiales bacterium]|nr:TetR/AcrR family transcriptional regulator [Acidimicrobiales bacterium]